MLANALPAVTGLVTAPLQARALGPEGRGTLAAILVPLAIAPVLLNLGVMQYAGKEAARGRPLSRLIGSLGAVYLVVGLVAIAMAVPVADLLADGRETVRTFLLIGFYLLPLALLIQLLIAVNSGLQRWPQVIRAQLIPPLTTLIGVVALYVTGHLTVATVAIVVLAGSLASALPLIGVIRRAGLPRIDGEIIREGVPFGAKAWAGTVASHANVRLDQLLMIKLVSARQLGLYAVAATLANFSGVIASAVASAANPRIAQGDSVLPARALRITLVAVGAVNLVLALLTPLLLKVVFGDAFAGAAPMAWVLLGGGVALGGVTVLANALISAGRPEVPAYGELLALTLTVPGLLVLLPAVGAVGAAYVSLCAYTLNFTVLLVAARRTFGGRLRDFLVPSADDLQLARALMPLPSRR